MKLSKFMQLTKVNVALSQISGVFTAEVVDKSGEVADYETTKKAFEKWSADIKKTSGGKSLGNIRKMHQKEVCGKVIEIVYDDVNKVISGTVEVNAQTIDEADKGYLNGFSIGGAYAKVWDCPVFKGSKRFTPVLAEISVVDNPCVPDATFEAIKDMEFAVINKEGATEMRKFAPRPADQAELDLEQVTEVFKAADGSIHDTKEAALAANKVAKDAIDDPVADALAKVDAALEIPASAATKISDFVNFEKGMYDIGRCASIICDLDWLRDSLDYEAAYEGDASMAPEALKGIVAQLCEFLKKLVEEETAELTGKSADGLVQDQVDAMRKVTGNAELFKDFKAPEPVAADSATAESLTKVTAERDAMLKKFEELPAQIEAKFDALTKRLKKIEEQPADMPGKLFVVEKDGDEPKEVKVTPRSMSPADQRNMMNR